MANEYIIPLGINAQEVLNGMSDIVQGAQQIEVAAQDAGNALTNNLNGAAAAATQLERNLQQPTRSLTELREAGRTAARDLTSALGGQNIGRDLEARIKGFKAQVQGMFSGLQVNVDSSQLQALQQVLAGTTNEFEQLNQAAGFARDLLNSMDPSSQEYRQLAEAVNFVEGALEGLNEQLGNTEQDMFDVNQSFEQVYGELQPLTTRLGELEDRMYELALAGQQNSDEFRALQAEAIRYRQTIQQVDAAVDTFSKTSAALDVVVEGATALTGAFAAVQGASALFGEENEEVEKALLKVNAAMAILQGLQSALAILNKDSAISALLLRNAQVAQAASTTAVAGATTAEAAATTAATVATRGFTAALLANPIVAIGVAIAAVVAALVIWASTARDTAEDLEDLNAVLERQNTLLELDESSITRRTNLLVANAKAQGVAESELTKIEGRALAERINTRQAYLQELQVRLNKELASSKGSAENVKQLQDQILKTENDIANMRNQLDVARINQKSQRIKEEDALNKQAVENAKKRAEEEKKINDQTIKFAREISTSRINILEDGYAKERRSIIDEYGNRIKDIQNETALSEAGQKAQTEAIAALTDERNKLLARLNERQAKDRLALQMASNQQLAELQKAGTQQDLELLNAQYEQRKAEIQEQFKDEYELRIQLLTALEANTDAQRKKIQAEGAKAQLETEERKELALIELSAKYAGDSEDVERKKQIAILQTKAEYAQKQLDLLLASGQAENSEAVLSAKAQVKAIQKELKGALDNDKTSEISFLDLIGLSKGLSASDLAAIKNAFNEIKNSISTITDAIVDNYQRQIDKSKEVVEALDDDISDLESKLDEEKELRDQGLANNVETIQAELDEKQRAKDEELKQQEEMVKKQTAIRRAQVAIDTAVQASNLITASTNIFSALSSIPFVGIPLAIATIGVMMGAFIAARTKAFKEVESSAQSFGKGGMIDGKSHSQGGQRYRSIDGRGGVVELEGKEYVINKDSTLKHLPLVEAINADDFSALSVSDRSIAELLDGIGVHLVDSGPKKAIKASQELSHLRVTVVHQESGSAELQNISKNISYLAEKERTRIQTWEDDQYVYRKEGSRTTRISKQQKQTADVAAK